MVRTGLMELLDGRLDLLAGRRIGLVTHPAAVLPDLTGAIPALIDAGVRLAALFGPEFSFSGAPIDGEFVADMSHHHTGLPVYTLYAENPEPTPKMLANLDALVLDLQITGTRYSFFLSVLYYMLRAAADAGLPVFILDRPDPLNGVAVEGPLFGSRAESSEGVTPIPVRHGMTPGELSLYMNTTYALNANLTITPMHGWRREMWFDETGLPWAPPLPDLPRLSTAMVYPGMCFFTRTNLSDGRGTALPFEVVGAPWLDGEALASRLNRLALPGVAFRPHIFRPMAYKFKGQVCEGVQVHVLERDVFRPVLTGLHLLSACRELSLDSFEFLPPPMEAQPPFMDLPACTTRIRHFLESGQAVDDLMAEWQPALEHFEQQRDPYLLYNGD